MISNIYIVNFYIRWTLLLTGRGQHRRDDEDGSVFECWLTHSRKQTAASFRVGEHNNTSLMNLCSLQIHFDLYFGDKAYLCDSLCAVFFSLLLSHTHTHTEKQAHTHLYLLVTRCQQEQVEDTLPHAEPSVCCCPSPHHARYTAYQHHNKAGTNKHSEEISRRRVQLRHFVRREIAAKASDKDWLWSSRTTDIFAGFSFSLLQNLWLIESSFQAQAAVTIPRKRHRERKGRVNAVLVLINDPE